MNLAPPKDINYAAIVVKVKYLVELPGLDRLRGMPRLGMQALVSVDTPLDEMGILLPTECELSEAFAYNNNLYRHAELNLDTEAKGYLEDNRRVRAIKFKGNRSDALYMPLSSLAFTGANLDELKEDDVFDKLNDVVICKKFRVKSQPASGLSTTQLKRKPSRIEAKLFPEHIETPQYFRVVDSLDPSADCIITQKLHGTSIRIGNTIVNRELNWRERLAKKLGVNVQATTYDTVYGSRKAIKDANNPNQRHYYKPLLTNNTTTVILPVWIIMKLHGYLDYLKVKVRL